MQGSQVSLTWAQNSLLPFLSCVFVWVAQLYPGICEMGSPTCRVFVGNVWARQLIRCLASHKRSVNGSSGYVLGCWASLSLICLIGKGRLTSLASQGWCEVDERQPGMPQALRPPLSFLAPPQQSCSTTHTSAQRTLGPPQPL